MFSSKGNFNFNSTRFIGNNMAISGNNVTINGKRMRLPNYNFMSINNGRIYLDGKEWDEEQTELLDDLNTYTFEYDNMDAIEAYTIFGFTNVTIHQAETLWAKTTILTRASLSDTKKIITMNKDVSKIEYRSAIKKSTLEIHIPASSFKKLKCEAGDITMSGVHFPDLIAEFNGDFFSSTAVLKSLNTHGTVKCYHLTCHSVSSDSMSGNATFTGLEILTGGLKISTMSGDVTVKGKIKSDVLIKTSSGDTSFTGSEVLSGGLKISTMSGDVTVKGKIKSDVLIETSSGDVSFIESEISTGGLVISTMSGDVATSGNVNGDISFNTTSGYITASGISCKEVQVSTMSGQTCIEQNGTIKKIHVKSVSGSLKGSGTCKPEFSTMSGRNNYIQL